MPLRTLFSEGWDEPWVAEPNDSGDAQQGWIDAADGNFYRLYFLSYTFTNRLSRGGNGHTGAYTVYTPLSRRLELITASRSSPPSRRSASAGSVPGRIRRRSTRHPTSTGFGDLPSRPA